MKPEWPRKAGREFVCLWVCYHDNSKLRASIFTKLGLYLKLIKFWPSCAPRKGSAAGRKFLAPPYVPTIWLRTSKFGLVTRGEGRVSMGRPRSRSKASGSSVLRLFADLLQARTRYEKQKPSFAWRSNWEENFCKVDHATPWPKFILRRKWWRAICLW